VSHADGRPPKVLISYAHEYEIDGHRRRALELAQSLRLRGVEAVIDQYEEHDPPNWPRWMTEQVKTADFVICLASPAYKDRMEGRGDRSSGLGARWEGIVITEDLYASAYDSHRKFIAVVLPGCKPSEIPDVLLPMGRSYYHWPDDDEILYRRITNQPRVLAAPLGQIVRLGQSLP